MYYSKSFWLGAATAGVIWLWRRRLRTMAVKGVKGGLLVAEGVKDNLRSAKNFISDSGPGPDTKGDMD